MAICSWWCLRSNHIIFNARRRKNVPAGTRKTVNTYTFPTIKQPTMKPAINRLVLVAIVLFVCLASISQAYVFIIPNAKSPDQEGHCYDETLKISVPVNEVRQRPERCESMSCGNDFSLHVAGCGVITASPGMIITKTNYSKPYPDCCPHLAMSSENLV